MSSRIPEDISALVLFSSDSTCCICWKPGLAVQIHHIDGNRTNHSPDNLAVLCLDCHNKTQISGGFGRKLKKEVVRLYRDGWLSKVAYKREYAFPPQPSKKITNHDERFNRYREYVRQSLMRIDYYLEHKEWFLLAHEFEVLEQSDLCIKYAKKAISEAIENERWVVAAELQGIFPEAGGIEPKVAERAIEELVKQKNYTQLARLYDKLDEHDLALKYYLKGIKEFIEQRNWFTTGYYLKETGNTTRAKRFFKRALKQAIKEDDVHLIIRCYQELDDTEAFEAYARDVLSKGDLDKISLVDLAILYRAVGKFEEADKLTEKVYYRLTYYQPNQEEL